MNHITVILNLFSLLGVVSTAFAGERPNIVIVMVDDLGYSDIGCYGGEINTPNLDALAQGGMRFRQFYNTGKCHSSRVTLLSGLHSYQAGNAEEDGSVKLHNGNVARGVSIAQVLQCWLLHCYLWEVAYLPEPRALGFDRFFGFLAGYIRDYFASEKLQLDGHGYVGGEGYITDLITNHGIEFIEEAHDQRNPFSSICPTMRHTILFRRRRKKLINTSGNTIRVGSPFANAVSKK